jgi:parvulin-like peptidyl-prolyl isomerase
LVPERRRRPPGGLLLLALLAALPGWSACRPADHGVVARSKLGEVRSVAFEAWLLDQPEAERQAPAAEDGRAWRRRRLEAMLAEEALLAEPDGQDDFIRDATERRWQQHLDDLVAQGAASRLPPIVIEEAELRLYYDRHPEEFGRKPAFVLRHIFRKTAAGAGEAEKRGAREALERYAAEARRGVFFDELARQHSDSETRSRGGRLGAIPAGKLGPQIDAILAALPEGGISPPVETPLGFHLFLLEKKVWLEGRSFAEARAELFDRFSARRQREAEEKIFADLLAKTGAKYYPDRLESAFGYPRVELFSLGGSRRFTAGDFYSKWEESSFLEQRERSLEARLRQEVLPMLLAFEAEREALAAGREVDRQNVRERRDFRLALAGQWRSAVWRAGLPEASLRRLFESRRASWQNPRLHHLRLLVLAVPEGAPPAETQERAEKLAAEIARGERDFGDAAFELSTDRSATKNGDLGFLQLAEVFPWVGEEARSQLAALAPGQLSPPLPLRRRDRETGRVVLWGIALFQLVEIREPGEPTFKESWGRLAKEVLRQETPALEAEWRRKALAEIDARIFEENL